MTPEEAGREAARKWPYTSKPLDHLWLQIDGEQAWYRARGDWMRRFYDAAYAEDARLRTDPGLEAEA